VFCDACQTRYPDDYRFCPHCGAALSAVSDDPDKLPVAPGERRQVTILFADLTDFTRLSTALDAEDLHALLEVYFARVDTIIEAYGGTVDKHIGDAVMALFGAPVAHPDDPVRAVRAAFDIHGALEGLVAQADEPLTAHVGIASGDVVAGRLGRDARQEYTVLGRSVNLAARLVDMAKARETLISDNVHLAVCAQIRSDAVGEVDVKGFDRPVAVWRAVETHATGTVGGVPFVGRQDELSIIAENLERCGSESRARIVFVRGEPGIGKSRLLAEASAQAEEEDIRVIMGQAQDFGVEMGKNAVAELTAALLDLPTAGRPDDAGLSAAADALDLAPGRRLYLRELLGWEPSPDEQAVFDVMDAETRQTGRHETLRELMRLAARTPLLCVLDDAQNLGPSARGDIEVLVGAAGAAPVLFLFAARHDSAGETGGWPGLAADMPLAILDVAALGEEEAERLAISWADDVGQEWLDTCLERAGGNPLFLEQLLREAPGEDAAALPPTLQSLVLARMDRLPEADKTALQSASALGTQFQLDAVRHITGRRDYAPALLLSAGLIRSDGPMFAFTHGLIREGVYGSLLGQTRAALHQRAADWFAERNAAAHAQHLDRAGSPAAAAAYHKAADEMATAYRFEAALELVHRGLAIAATDADTTDLSLDKARVLEALGRSGEAAEAYEAAAALAVDDESRCAAQLGIAGIQRLQGRNEAALATLEDARSIAERAELERELAQTHVMRGNIRFAQGQYADCEREHAQAMNIAKQAGLPREEARALGGMGDAMYAQSRMVTSNRYFQRCIDLCRQHGFRRVALANLSMLGHGKRYLNDLDGAHRDCAEAAEEANRAGQQRAEMLARRIDADVLLEMGALVESAAQAEAAIALAERIGSVRFVPILLVFQAKIAAARGDVAGARVLLAVAEQRDLAAESPYSGPMIQSAKALFAEGAEARATALAEGERLLPGTVSHNHFWFYRDAIDASLSSGDWDGALRYAEGLRTYTAAEPVPLGNLFIARAEALAALGQAREAGAPTKDAVRQVEAVRAEAARVGFAAAIAGIDDALAAAA